MDKLIDEDWEFPADEPSPEDTLIRNSIYEQLYRYLGYLNGDERELIQALYFEEMSIREYAELIGESKSSVDRQKTKILEKLKNFFKK